VHNCPERERAMIHALRLLIAVPLLAAAPARAAPEETLRVELNALENVQGRCRYSFVVENKGEAGVESLKLDLAVFGRDGVVQRRLVTEMGPLRRAKTMLRAFELEGECGQIGSILLNDVTACAPGDPASCLDALALTSRVQGVRLYK
jgi:hypothetical protein